MARTTFAAVTLAAATVLALPHLAPAVHSQAGGSAAVAGTVRSKTEGAMEGVLVTLQRDGSTITTTVASDAQGRYSFPRDRVEPGKYTVAVRAQGFDLPATAVSVPAHGAATLDLTLQ